jgi:hypothetical protein
MRKHVLIGLLALVGATSAQAMFQWDVYVSEFDGFDCWNPASGAPTLATVSFYNPADPADSYLVECNIFGPGGQPLAYAFQAAADDIVDCGTTYVIDELYMLAEGPGFRYEFTHVPTPFTLFYSCGPNFPINIDLTPPLEDTCVEVILPDEWTFENFPNGRVDITEDFVLEEGEHLFIEAGMQVYGLPGTKMIINGEMMVEGTEEHHVMIHGENWGGMVFGAGGDATFHYTTVTGVMSEDDGGAFHVGNGAVVRLLDCLVAHNSTEGMGGAAYIEDGGIFYTYGSTISHNTASDGGNFYLGGGFALLEGELNLITFATPENTDIVGAGLVTINFSNIYPQNDNFPNDWPGVDWYCDPGYVDPMNWDFNIAYWSPTEPGMINCTIDVAINEDTDADGTPRDMGAFFFDQHQILHSATLLAAEDRPNDQGGFVLLSFAASRNDGSPINPVTMYSVWVQYPGASEDEWVSAGTVPALGESDMTYVIQVATLDDQYGEMENIHNFVVGTHSVWFPEVMPSNEITGFSLDNIAPMPVAGVEIADDWSGDWSDPELSEVTLAVQWAPSNANDLSHYEVFATLNGNANTRTRIYQGLNTSLEHTIVIEEHSVGDIYEYEFFAIDNHLNVSDVAEGASPVFTSVGEQRALSFDLAQNFPNPFNPSTTIAFELAQPSTATLTVFNLLGETVATLVNEPLAAGRHQVTFDAGRLASGVYMYRLEAGEYNALRKMILVK